MGDIPLASGVAAQALELDTAESWGAAAHLAEGREEKFWYDALLHQGWAIFRIFQRKDYWAEQRAKASVAPETNDAIEKGRRLYQTWMLAEEQKAQDRDRVHTLLEKAWKGLSQRKERRFQPRFLLAAEPLCQLLEEKEEAKIKAAQTDELDYWAITIQEMADDL